MNIYKELENRALEFVTETGSTDKDSISDYLYESLCSDAYEHYGDHEVTSSVQLYWDKLYEKIEQAQQEEREYQEAKEEARTH